MKTYRSIKFKLVVLFLTLVLFVMIGSGLFIRLSIQNAEANRAYETLVTIGTQIQEEILRVASEPVALGEALVGNPIIFRVGIQTAVLDMHGVSILTGEPYTTSVIISAMAGTAAFTPWERTQDLRDEQGLIGVWMSYATPLYLPEQGQYLIIYLRQNVQDIQDSLDNITTIIVMSIVLSLLVATVLGVIFARNLTEPISDLTKIAKEMAKGKLNQKIPVNSDDEIGQLAENFNYMGESLQNRINEIYKTKNRGDIIVRSMKEGIVSFSRNGDLTHVNQEARDLLNLNEVNYNRVANTLGKEINLFTEITDKQMTINEKAISLSITTYPNEVGEVGGCVIVLRDITKHALLENMRKEFVANVSHEIRTPLTVIKTYAETLIDMGVGDEMVESFLEVINSEVDKMTVLTTDLLELSQFDNKQLKLMKAPYDLLEILVNSIEQTVILAEKKNQAITFYPKVEEMPFLCDHSRMSQVFTNLVSNAVKYSEENRDIEITAQRTQGLYEITIKDNGIGIAKEDLERVFERFYRVDKARTRDVGGTGLGLAIVKEIVEAHGGKIRIESQLGKGSRVHLQFKAE